MVSENEIVAIKNTIRNVLILVLVEDGLGARDHPRSYGKSRVLILVLVEDGLGEFKKHIQGKSPLVLILVFVGDGLGVAVNVDGQNNVVVS